MSTENDKEATGHDSLKFLETFLQNMKSIGDVIVSMQPHADKLEKQLNEAIKKAGPPAAQAMKQILETEKRMMDFYEDIASLERQVQEVLLKPIARPIEENDIEL